MCKKLIFLISFVLLLGLVSNASAEEDVYWTDGDPCDHLWSSPNNWDAGRCPKSIDPASDLGDCAYIQPDSFALENFPIVDDSVIKADPNTGSHPLTVIVGVWYGGDAYMTMTGGYIHTDWEVILGLHKDANGTLNMSGGLIELDGSELFIGDGGIGHLNMIDPCGTGGGVIDTNGGPLALPGESGFLSGSGGGTGIINLDAGTIICGSIFMQEPSTIDINEGTLIIQGNATGVVTGYVESGWITGRGSTDPRNTEIVYDDVNDITIVTYDPTPDLTLPWKPRPLPSSTVVHWKPTLSWEPGCYADTHDVYFGTSESEVSDANTASDPNIYRGNQPGTTYPIGSFLEFDQTYYWRIDEVNDACAPGLWPGAVWFFTIGDYVVVDDFDSYAADEDIKAVWNDKTDGGINATVYVENTIVRDGNSMKYDYSNYTTGPKPKYSEAWANPAGLDIGQDWTGTGSAKAMVLYFYGDSYNDANEQMYVALEDAGAHIGLVTFDDMNAVEEALWHEWNIDLQDPCFSGVDMNNVAKVYIGFGVRGNTSTPPAGSGAGTVYFDDIRVYPARCVAEFGPAGDFTGECRVDYADVNVMAHDWLLSDYIVTATEPPTGPVGWWKLDEGEGADPIAYDSAGSNDGTVDGPVFVPSWENTCGDPCHEPCLNLDGVGYVDVPIAAFADISDEITVTLWQYGDSEMSTLYPHVMFHACDAEVPFDLTVKGEFYDLSAEGCEVFFDAGFGGDENVDSVSKLAIPENYTGQWNHWAFVKNANASVMKIYLNGELFASGDGYNSPMTGTDIAVFKIGSYYDGVSRFYDGYMSDFRLYNYALSHGEVRYVAGMMDDLYVPLPTPAVDMYEDGKVNFKDYAVLANAWLVETFWP